jgi:hypothetical protein
MNLRALFIAGILFLLPTLAWGSTAWDAIWQSETAIDHITLVGSAQTTLAGEERTISARAKVRGARGSIRFDYDTGRRRWSLIDDGRRLMELKHDRKIVAVRPRMRLAVDRSLAERNYVAREVGTGTVAGRRVRAYEVTRREGGGPALNLWLDKATGFALKRERYTVEGKLATATEYTQVDFGASVPADVFRPPTGWRLEQEHAPPPETPLDVLSEKLGFTVRSPRYLPPGYALLGSYQSERGRWEREMAELRYTDGLRTLSVFERAKGRGEQAAPRRYRGGSNEEADQHQRGRTEGGRGRGRGRGRSGGGPGFGPPEGPVTVVAHGYEQAVRYLTGDLVVIVIGDLTSDELLRIAHSFDRN